MFTREVIGKDEKPRGLEHLYEYVYDEDIDMMRRNGMPADSVHLLCLAVLAILVIL